VWIAWKPVRTVGCATASSTSRTKKWTCLPCIRTTLSNGTQSINSPPIPFHPPMTWITLLTAHQTKKAEKVKTVETSETITKVEIITKVETAEKKNKAAPT